MPSIVQTSHGELQGFEAKGHQVFRGIPFARPPVGDLRFRSPEPAEPWSGVRDATAFGPSCPQRDLPIPIFQGWDVGPQDEDCLYLNVTTPGADSARRPVMVWIHGGGFTLGSGSQAMYDVTELVRRGDVVAVTVNYRLGPFGFLHLDDLLGEDFGASGNAGIEDQIAGLRWVSDNIAAFGGDPGNVTIFGESAGGMSVGTLLGAPSAAGLFHRAIPQSGASHNANSRDQSTAVARAVLEHLGLDATSAEQLRTVSSEKLLGAHDQVVLANAARGGALLPFQPCVDGRTLPETPIDAVAGGLSAGIPVLVGSCRDEWNLFGLMDPSLADLDDAGVLAKLEAAVGGEAKRLLEAYRSARGENSTSRELFLAIQTDRVFRIPAVRLAEAQAEHQPDTYQYLFTWESPIENLGSCHGIDVPFVFGQAAAPPDPDAGAVGGIFGGSGPKAEALTAATMEAWLAFARTGNPNHAGLPSWPRFDRETRSTMLFGESCAVVDAPLDDERRAWGGLLRDRS